jgi:hypothetical protein
MQASQPNTLAGIICNFNIMYVCYQRYSFQKQEYLQFYILFLTLIFGNQICIILNCVYLSF